MNQPANILGRPHGLSDKEKNEILRLKNAGHSKQSLAVRFNVSEKTIQRVKSTYKQNTKASKRPVKKTTSAPQRAVARVLKDEGYSNRQASKRTGMHHTTVGKAVKRFAETNSDKDQPRQGRPRLSTDRDDRLLHRASLKDRFQPATRLAEDWEKSGVTASARTVRSRLADYGLNGCVARKKPLLTSEQKKTRLAFAKRYQHWTEKEWERVLWTDESPFSIFGECGKTYVRRRPGEEYNDDCLQPTVKYGGGKIQVWGCFTADGVGDLHWIKENMDSKIYKHILIHHMRPSLQRLGGVENLYFQQDNDPKHTAKDVQAYLKSHYVCLEGWPPQSPDLNPIENLWWELNQKLVQVKPQPSNKDMLFDLLKQEWSKLHGDTLKALVHSMPHRLEAVIKAKGGQTKY